jgi:hypothetical protein
LQDLFAVLENAINATFNGENEIVKGSVPG